MALKRRLCALNLLLAWTGSSAEVPFGAVNLQAAPSGTPAFDRSVLGNLKGGGNISTTGRIRFSRSNAMIASISVGTPPQEIRCLLDSGSSDLWVPSKRCETCENKHHFRADKSSTFMAHVESTPDGDRPLPVHIAYGSGEIVGYDVQDSVTIGSVTLPNQTFVIVEEAALPPHRTWDGICGLGWRRMAKAGKPLYAHLQAMGGRAIFGLVPQQGNGDFITVGSDQAQATCKPGTLVWAEAETIQGERSFWVTTGGLAIHKNTPVKSRFLVDTGTTFLLVPPRFYQSLVRSVFPEAVFEEKCGVDPSAGGLVVCDCSVVHARGMLPLRVQLGGREFALPVDKLFKKVHAKNSDEELCLLQMQQNPLSTNDPMDLLSDLLGGMGGDTGGAMGGQGMPIPLSPMPPGAELQPPQGDAAEAAAAAGGSAAGDMPIPMMPLPFPMAGAPMSGGGRGEDQGGFPFPMPMGGGGRGPAVGEQVEEMVSTRPDGTVCRHIVVREAGKVTKNSTECEAGGEAQDAFKMPPFFGSRRLQFGGLPIGVATEQEDPLDDLWVLGGTFLEHFVSIFDFDHARLGFCEPSGAAAANSGVAGGLRAYQVAGGANLAGSALSSVGMPTEAPPTQTLAAQAKMHPGEVVGLVLLGCCLVAGATMLTLMAAGQWDYDAGRPGGSARSPHSMTDRQAMMTVDSFNAAE